jgi:hypothetical protein
MQNDITINQVTYHVSRVYAKAGSVSSIIQERMQRDLKHSAVLTEDRAVCYNEPRGVVGKEEAT